MDELRKDKKQIEKEISRVINRLEKKYDITVSDINIYRAFASRNCIDKKLIKSEAQVEIEIKI